VTPRSLAIAGSALVLAGLGLTAWGRSALAFARRRGVLAVRGPYGCVRHPQYAGLLVTSLGLLFIWPRPEGLLALGTLAAGVVWVAAREEAHLERDLGCVWRAYAFGRTAFVPRPGSVRRALAALVQPTSRGNGPDLAAGVQATARERASS